MASKEINLFSLPDEVLTVLLEYDDVNCSDILSFGLSCKQLNTFVKTNQVLWKRKIKSMLSSEIAQIFNVNSEGDWYSYLQSYYAMKNSIYFEVCEMSTYFYWRIHEISFPDVVKYFELAISNTDCYYFTIYILVNMHKNSQNYPHLQEHKTLKPYTLTEMHYTRVILRYLIHAYLMLKWHQMICLNQMIPENVVHFFLQWIDTTNIHSVEDNKKLIDEMVVRVEGLLPNTHPLKSVDRSVRDEWANHPLDDNMWNFRECEQIHTAVAQIIYKDKHMAVTSELNLDTLDLKKVVVTRCSNAVIVLMLYEALARRCGVRCDFIAFPNHLFLEWKANYKDITRPFLINHVTGELQQKRQCPFAERGQSTQQRNKYCPESLVHYLLSSYNQSIGAIRDWTAQNAIHLVQFFGIHDVNDYNPYRHVRQIFADLSKESPVLNTPLDLTCMQPIHNTFIMSLVNHSGDWNKTCRNFYVKKRDSLVKYAIGMICYHMKYDYVCIIRGWDNKCNASLDWQSRMGVHTLKYGSQQPFYNVIAADYSERYVAQENLQIMSRPRRLYHLEEVIAREFSHFDDFGYVPNNQKRSEFPDDDNIRNFYRNRSQVNRSVSLDYFRSTASNQNNSS